MNEYQRRQQQQPTNFGPNLLSTFLGVLAALIVFGVGVRLYIHWSVRDAWNPPPAQKAK